MKTNKFGQTSITVADISLTLNIRPALLFFQFCNLVFVCIFNQRGVRLWKVMNLDMRYGSFAYGRLI